MENTKPTSATFEVFQAQIRPKRLEANQASLTKTNILISESLAKKFGDVDRVLLLFNRETQEIGIRPAGRQHVGSYKLSYRSISSRSFYQHFKIEARGRFPATINPLGMIVISLR